jgi:hypothetical protein
MHGQQNIKFNYIEYATADHYMLHSLKIITIFFLLSITLVYFRQKYTSHTVPHNSAKNIIPMRVLIFWNVFS